MTATPRILIADDDPLAIEILENTLEGMGELCCATSGAEALALMASAPADLILLDARMPDMDGFTTCRLLKQDCPDVPVIFVTALSEEQRELQALKLGAVDFIHKPIKPPVVRARVAVHLQLHEMNTQLRDLSARDPLTGVANRRAFDERLDQEWRRAIRQQQPLGLLMIDIDHFKRYNDHYGHQNGDACLRQIAQILTTTVLRGGDLVARYGGEEFAVLLPGSDRETTHQVAERLCAAVRAQAIPHADSDVAPIVTLSIGAASGVPAGRTPDAGNGSAGPVPAVDPGRLASGVDLVARADRALYVAKARGRDQARQAEDSPGGMIPSPNAVSASLTTSLPTGDGGPPTLPLAGVGTVPTRPPPRGT